MSPDPRVYGGEFDSPTEYEIRVRGWLEVKWSDWFGGLTIRHAAGDVTVLSGTLIDQPALAGVLNKLCELGLPLLSVTRLDRRDEDENGRQSDA